MEGFTAVGKIDDFPEGRGRAVDFDDRRVAVFRLADRWCALQDACPHMGASLADGKVDGDHVVCTWHDRRFHLTTGNSDMRSGACARTYEVRIHDGSVYLKTPSPPPTDPDADWVKWDDSFLR